jgi:hypothetical protein
MKNHTFTAKFGKFLDTILHGKYRKCKYYKTCKDARKNAWENIERSAEF